MTRSRAEGTAPKRRTKRTAKTLHVQLGALETAGLIFLAHPTPEIEYLFRHALVQDAAYSSLLKQQRRALHEAIGLSLERIYPQRLDELAPVLANHFFEADDHARALHYYARAGDLAARKYANAEAVMHYTRALASTNGTNADHATLLHIFTSLGRVLEVSGDYAGALQHYLDMESFARAKADRALELAALIARATIRSAPTTAFDEADAQSLAEQSLALARELGDRAAEAKVLWNLALLNRFRGRSLQSLAYGEQAAALARELNLRDALAHILNDILSLYTASGEPQRARDGLTEAGAIWRELGNLPMLADNLATSAGMEIMVGNYARALALAEESLRISVSIHNLWNQSYSLWHIGMINLDIGDIDRAISSLEAALALGEQAGFSIGRIAMSAILGLAYAFLGDSQCGLEYARRALRFTEDQFASWRAMPTAMLAMVHILRGELPDAETLIQQAHSVMNEGDMQSYIYLTLADGELGLAKADYAHMLTSSESLVKLLESASIGALLGWALYHKAEALLGLVRLDEAYETFTRAAANERLLGSRRFLWQILARLSELEARRGNAAEAQMLRGQAREVVAYIAAHIAAPELRTSFLARPAVQTLMQSG